VKQRGTEDPRAGKPFVPRLDPETSEALRTFAQARYTRPGVVARKWIAERLRETKGDYQCSFCGKQKAQVKSLIAGPMGSASVQSASRCASRSSRARGAQGGRVVSESGREAPGNIARH
jgi:hypothetical protein